MFRSKAWFCRKWFEYRVWLTIHWIHIVSIHTPVPYSINFFFANPPSLPINSLDLHYYLTFRYLKWDIFFFFFLLHIPSYKVSKLITIVGNDDSFCEHLKRIKPVILKYKMNEIFISFFHNSCTTRDGISHSQS